MFLYFYQLEGRFYHEVMAPALASAHRQRSWDSCGELCRQLLAESSEIPADSVIRAVAAGVPFERLFWQGLAGECLVHGASAIPRFATAPSSLCCLLAPDNHANPDLPRASYAPSSKRILARVSFALARAFIDPITRGSMMKQMWTA